MKIQASFVTNKGTVQGAFEDGQGRQRQGWEAIFPIVQMLSEQHWRPVGTGFFISNNGMFATAKHVLVDSNGEFLPGLFGLHFSHDLTSCKAREIVKVDLHGVADVAIGILFDKPFNDGLGQTLTPLLGLTAAVPKQGDRVVSFAYPDSKGQFDGNSSTMQLRGNAMEGLFEEYYPDGRDRVLLPGPCVRTTMPLASGASGGPVAFGNGAVFGVNSTGYDGTDISYISPISCILDLSLQSVSLPDGSVHERVGIPELIKLRLIQLF